MPCWPGIRIGPGPEAEPPAVLVMDKGIPPPAGWSFFDRAYCISLRKRADRREAVRAEFARVGLIVEFVMAH